jgi:hypothetical protein
MPRHDDTRPDRDTLRQGRLYSGILRKINDRPGISGTELVRSTRSVSIEDREAILSTMIARGLITKRKDSSGRGRPRLTYWPAGQVKSTPEYRAGRIDGMAYVVDGLRKGRTLDELREEVDELRTAMRYLDVTAICTSPLAKPAESHTCSAL